MNLDEAFSQLLDELIPEDSGRRMPGAGSLGLGARLRRDAPEIMPAVDAGLQSLHERALAQGAAGFGALPAADRVASLQALSEEQPGLIPALLFHLSRCYYAHPKVLSALGMPGRPPYPEGYEMEPNDLGLLDAVRERGRLYREA